MTHRSIVIHRAHRVMFSFMICLQTSHRNKLVNKQVWNSIIKTPILTSLLMMRGRMRAKCYFSYYLTLVTCWEFPNRILLRDPRIAQHYFPSNQSLTRGLGNTWLWKEYNGKIISLCLFYARGAYLHSSIVWHTEQSKKQLW